MSENQSNSVFKKSEIQEVNQYLESFITKENQNVQTDLNISNLNKLIANMLELFNEISSTHSGANQLKEEKDMPKLKEGTIRLRKDGRYEGRYMNYGKQKSVYAKTQKECLTKLKKAIKNRGKNITLAEANHNITLDKWFFEWLQMYKKDIKDASKKEITNRYQKYVKNAFGRMQIKRISAIELQKFFSNNTKNPSSMQKLYREMKSIFQKAKVLKYIKDNPMEAVEFKSKHTPKNEKVPTENELESFLCYLELKRPILKYFIKLVALTGMRLGEICALELNDIDFENKTIRINKAVLKTTNEIDTPKTEKSIRDIPLFKQAEQCIKDYVKLYEPKDRLFYNLKSRNVSNSVIYYADKFGFVGVSTHTFRKYFATICKTYGIDSEVVKEWLGHEDSKLTLNTYTQIHQTLWLKEAEKFNSKSKKPTLN